jgi:hypothetical protein
MTQEAPIVVLHLLGGQAVIGSVRVEHSANGRVTHWVENPYEILVAPNESNLKTTVALVEYGTMMGVLPSLRVSTLSLVRSQIVALPITPDPVLLAKYLEARDKSVEERIKIDEQLRSSQTDITKNGTL